MEPSHSVNLQLSIEQVNHQGENCVPTYWSNRSSPQPPLDNVVDPNTEFKRSLSRASNSASPEISFGLKDVIKELQRKNTVQTDGVPDLDTSHPIFQQLQEAYTAVVYTRPLSKNGSPAPVHLQSPRRSFGPAHTDLRLSSPAQVATILKEKEPELVTELLTYMNSEDKNNLVNIEKTSAKMDGYKDLSEFTIEIPHNNNNITSSEIPVPAENAAVVNIENTTQNHVLTSPSFLDGKTLHKFPPGYVTVLTERGTPHTPEPQKINRYRKSSQSSQSSYYLQNNTKHPSEYYNMTSSTMEPTTWNADNNGARYGSISNISDISLYNPERKNLPTSPLPYRSQEQIAWAIRNTRDRFETGSNFSACSSNLDSVCSERLETMSMISDVSGYEEEMFRIKKLLLDPSTGKSKSKKAPYVPPQYNKSVMDPVLPLTAVAAPMNTELVSTHGQMKNIKTEQDIIAIEKKYEAKVQDLLRNQAHTEGKLEAARNELERFIQERSHLLEKIAELEPKRQASEKISKLEEELLNARQTMVQQEGKLREIQGQLQRRERETSHWQEERQANETEITRLRLDGEELRLELDTRIASVQGLKAKVAEQHTELQVALQARLQAEAASAQARAESEALRASQLWYKDQLGKAQEARSAAQQLASATSTQLAAKDTQHESLLSQVATLNQQLAEAERQVVREKRTMLQQLETFEADMVAREAELTHRMSGGEGVELVCEREALRVSQLEATCTELQQQLETARSQMKAGEEAAHQLSSDHATLLGRTTSLRQQVAERDLQLQQASDQLAALDASNCRLRSDVTEKDKTLNESRNQVIKLKVSLDAANREKAEVDKAIENLNSEFSQISLRYQRMKQDLKNKESSLVSIQANVNEITKERDNLKEELIESKLKIEGYSEFTQKQVDSLKQEIENGKLELTSLQQENEKLKEEKAHIKSRYEESELQVETQLQQNQELAGRIAELSAGKSKAERRALKLQESVTFREEQLLTAQQGMEQAHNTAREAVEKSDLLKQQSQALQVEMEKLRDELQRSDAVVKQYAALCRSHDERRASRVNDATQTTPNRNKSDKTTMSDLELISNLNLVNDKSIESVNISIQHSPETQHQCINTDNNIDCKSELLSNKKTITVNSTSQTDFSLDAEKEDLLMKISNLEEKLSKLKSKNDEGSQLRADILKLQGQVEKADIQARESRRKYQANVGTLLRTLKEHMRGRKWAERELAQAQTRLQQREGQNVEALNMQILELQEQLRNSTERLQALRETESKTAEALIELERERGRLEGVSTSQSSLREHVTHVEGELASTRHQLELLEHEKEVAEARATQQLQEIQQTADASAKMVQDLHKQVLNERRESSSLRQQLSSTRVGLDNANQLLESRASELAVVQEQLEAQRAAALMLETQLKNTHSQLLEAQTRAESLGHELQLSKEKDPLLADQLKRLSDAAQQRGTEAQACRQMLQQAEQRWAEQEKLLTASLSSSQEEAGTLRTQLDEARRLRFSLQTLAAELRGALHASLEQGKNLRARLSSLESTAATPCNTLPDLTSSLPVPAALDEGALAELLQRSSAPPPPLTHLQSCLHSLQQEVNTLQQQLEQRSALSTKNNNTR